MVAGQLQPPAGTSMVGNQLSLSLVRNANNSGCDLKETVRLAILHLQKTGTGNLAKTITTLLGMAQAIAEADNWKKARDATAGQKYAPLNRESIQKLFCIIADGNTPKSATKMRAAVPSAEAFQDEWTVVKCAIRRQFVIKDPDSEEAVVAVRSELNTAHRILFDAIKEAMAPFDTLATLRVGNSALAQMCTKYDKDTRLAPDVFMKVDGKVKMLPDMLPAVALLRAAFDQQGSTSASTTSAAFAALTNGIQEDESMTAHLTRLRESAEKILEMHFADLAAFLDSVQANSAYTKMCAMRNTATTNGDNLKSIVWREACLKVCVDMSADPRPLTLERINPILRDAYTALDDGLGNQDELATNSLATRFQEHSDTVTKDLNTLKSTVLFKSRGRGRGTPPRGRGNYRGGFTARKEDRGGFHGGRGGHSGRDDISADASAQGGRGGRGGQQDAGGDDLTRASKLLGSTNRTVLDHFLTTSSGQQLIDKRTTFDNAKKLLKGLCYTCSSPDHRSGDHACKGQKP